MTSSNAAKLEEIDSIKSIYEDQFEVLCDATQTYRYSVMTLSGKTAHLEIQLNDGYPEQLSSPPPLACRVRANWMGDEEHAELSRQLHAVVRENPAVPLIFLLIERVRQFFSLDQTVQQEDPAKCAAAYWPTNENKYERSNNNNNNNNNNKNNANNKQVNVVSCREIVDRKSKFQGHAARCHDLQDFQSLVRQVTDNPHCVKAKHNVTAYRFVKSAASCVTQPEHDFKTGKKSANKKSAKSQQRQYKAEDFETDADNDGEAGADKLLSKLLENCGATNIGVVVTRWFGGIEIGPARFKHYKQAALDAIELLSDC